MKVNLDAGDVHLSEF